MILKNLLEISAKKKWGSLHTREEWVSQKLATQVYGFLRGLRKTFKNLRRRILVLVNNLQSDR